MSDHYSQDPLAAKTVMVACPSCKTRGLIVERRTVKALLAEPACGRLQCAIHRFCRTAECPIVYYDETGATYERTEVRVRVWEKEPFGDRLLCYCFGESEATIQDELKRHGRSEAVRRVTAHIAANRCACDVRNPRGVCCLGDLMAAVKRIDSKLLVERGV